MRHAHRHTTSLFSLLMSCTVLFGCATTSPPPPEPSARQLELHQRILQETLAQLGRPYSYGGADSQGFDCSGLVHHVYADAGILLPRTAAQQRAQGRAIPQTALLPGDLLFYRIDGGDHVVVYIGEGRGVHAPRPGKTVTIAEVDRPWWQQRLHSARRLLPP
ncbi:C40 family peptidase [Algiphilus sp.]|uniref:C40 family peptidase n=1 Tax=Algiphilus sp. TaxID=1872431 RepID=UPI001CA6DA00|nr:C40 family peptidase [Algiphilus sp.]MBY8966664.1 C40 family peptidase [Algiphilus acroporae]MCI5104441.1 C40 family peptidase [Algiphilus sp.]MCR9090360.1 C40 family peptidase [Pseudomonadota bacterium]